MALPRDPELISDLTVLDFEVLSRGIKVTPKDKVVKILGRSPDKGDAVAMSWDGGLKVAQVQDGWRKDQRSDTTRTPKVHTARGRKKR